ncbi:glutaminyl-tRNA synthase (glutamine-hydrolyzing) subunit A [Candidatus Adlerbacteria bacterium RIFCSPHIGHO2_12_FULL_53_18]|uniref:Glutamyl-tRNA(Gln) amidotransferase subunit A n=1 Tax=Candidatus Adlerbacteria bacterium RIFCSPHIGHO2_12_FULL_53_18 TaxID=1797242 RepID=A0A1F4XTB4_9BACT|nr:MAG: glutaminyl-tRNA synthase (glutamine-hydrolyzing) subunit A [Candidatus Adlerbacteria bacterium RIFCSPHIGHO2_12_FULL_53_18]
MSNLAELSITEASKKLAAKEISAADLARACLATIEAKNPELNVYLEVFDDVEAQATEADARRAKGEKHPLLGIPLAFKDNILIEGRRASAASKILEGYVASYDATVIKKLKEAGTILLGRTNMDEFAHGSSTENSAYGPTKNPHDTSRVPGGSSGGSAAAVAAGMALGALGTDTGGSIREPASFCGLVGLKPTYGAVSRSGLIAMGSSLDQAGPLTRTTADTELIFNTIRGKDPLDSTSIDEHFYPKYPLKKKIGVPRDLLQKGIDKDVLEQFEAALSALKTQGYEIVDIKLPSAGLALAIYYVIMPAEVSANLARFDGVRYGLSLQGSSQWEDYAKTRGAGFGAEVRRRVMLGTYVLSSGYYEAYYGTATAARVALSAEVARALESVDAIATPTAPSPATKLGEKVADPLAMYLLDIFTATANLTGNPAISVPMDTVAREGKDLPVGIQFTAAHGNEETLFAIGKKLEAKEAVQPRR